MNLLDLGGGIVLADQFLGQQAFDQVLALKVPDLKGLPAHLRQRSTQVTINQNRRGYRRSKDIRPRVLLAR